MKTRIIVGLTAIALFVSVAFAATLTGTTFGDATSNGDGSYTLTSDAAPGYGGVNFNTPATFDFSDINVLKADDQTPESDDTCIGGSPRFQLNVDTDEDGDFDGNVFVYTEGGCPGDTGNLIGVGGAGDAPGTYDTSQLVGGTQVSNYSATAALFASNPTWSIIGVQFVVDSSWKFTDGEQTITATPVIDIDLDEATDANACKNGGWQFLQRADGSTFKNQGDCVSYTRNGK